MDDLSGAHESAPSQASSAEVAVVETAALETSAPPSSTRRSVSAPKDWRGWLVAHRISVPVHLMAFLIIPAFMFAQHKEWIAHTPIWILGSGLLLAQAYSVLIALLEPPKSTLQMSLRCGLLTASIASVIYGTGWAGALTIGFAYAGNESMRAMGARAGRHVIGWALVSIVVGEILIGLGAVESMLPEPEVHGLALFAGMGTVIIIAAMTWTASEKEAAQDTLRRSEERFRALVQHASDAILVMAPDTELLYISPAFEQVLGFSPGTIGKLNRELVHPDDLEWATALYFGVVQRPGGLASMELRMLHADGHWRWLEVDMTNRVSDPSVGGIVWNMHDVTDRKVFETELRHHAYHDPLTTLPNRTAFVERLERALASGKSEGNSLALLFLDLDRFKLVNDSLGHEIGDRLLVTIAQRLESCLRVGDYLARFGGDEFTILVEGIPDDEVAESIQSVAERIVDVLRLPVVLGSHEFVISSSIGVSISTHGATASSDLLRQADLAMYVAKDKGRARWEVFDPESALPVFERLEVEGDMWRAIDNRELVVFFQPEMSLVSGRVVTVEALVRWEHPLRGFLMPNSFIPFAEESNLIVAVDRYVLREACVWARRWADERPGEAPVVISVNLSPRFVYQVDVVADILSTIREAGVDPSAVQLEITERTALADIEGTAETLSQLRAHGVRVAIDDFGTGYSSLSYLRRLPVDVVKLDKSFVDDMDSVDSDAAIVQAAITMGHALGMKVTAEGVERASQAERLRSLGCDSATGWFWSKALPAAEVGAVVAAGFTMPGTEPNVLPLRPVART